MEGDKVNTDSGKERKTLEHLVPAGQESNLLSKKQKRKLPREGMYSEATKIYSPVSRGF
ncbi:MAG: hypothetical protein HFH90_04165 [Lachnospiraceae bacterium]|jgi:hypothetical protein|nr:hypothetical protein [Lachnospiraceae bacterium]